MKSTLDTTHEITKLVKYSPRRESLFNVIKDEIAPGNIGIRTLCPTRWTVKADTMKSIIKIIIPYFKNCGNKQFPLYMIQKQLHAYGE